MRESDWLRHTSAAFQLMIASSWIAPASCREIQDEAVQRACDARPNWTEYLQLVDRHRTPASSWAVLKRISGPNVPEQVKRELQRRSDLCRRQAMLHLQLLAGILRRLNQGGIPVMPLKGPLLSLALYGDVGLRQSKDIDILVPQSEIRRTQEYLEDMGWRLAADYFVLSPRQLEATLLHEYHVGYLHPQQGCQLELHWRWSSPQWTEQDWTKGRTNVLSGFSYHVMNEVDLAIYLAGHGGAHRWFRAKWLGDLARLHCQGQVDWAKVLTSARSLHQHRPMLLSLQLLSECYHLVFPNVPQGLLSSSPNSLVSAAVCALRASRESDTGNFWERLKECVQLRGNLRGLWPHRSWWTGVTHSRLDFRILRIPDRLFWAYTPLRPLLWLWRRPRVELQNYIIGSCRKINESFSVRANTSR